VIAYRYHDLVCWQLANELKRRVYAFTGTEPAVKDLKYCDQIRDSARSAPSNIAEARKCASLRIAQLAPPRI
jgi:four helix bundle protein